MDVFYMGNKVITFPEPDSTSDMAEVSDSFANLDFCIYLIEIKREFDIQNAL